MNSLEKRLIVSNQKPPSQLRSFNVNIGIYHALQSFDNRQQCLATSASTLNVTRVAWPSRLLKPLPLDGYRFSDGDRLGAVNTGAVASRFSSSPLRVEPQMTHPLLYHHMPTRGNSPRYNVHAEGGTHTTSKKTDRCVIVHERKSILLPNNMVRNLWKGRVPRLSRTKQSLW